MEGRGVPRPQNEVFLPTERRRHAVDSNYNYKNEDDHVGGRSSSAANGNLLVDGTRLCRSPTAAVVDGVPDRRSGGGRTTVAPLKGTGIIIDPRSPSSSAGAEERAAAAAGVTGCLRSPGSVDGSAARRSNGKRVTFDGHDAGVGNDGVIASHDKRGVVVVTAEATAAELGEGRKEDRLSSAPGFTSVSCAAGCHSDRLTGMPEGSTTAPSSVAVNRHDRTKTGCFGCISRKNAKSMAADQDLMTKSAVPHYGSTGKQSPAAAAAPAARKVHDNHSSATDRQLFSDACHATTSRNVMSSGAADKEAPKTKHCSAQNSNQLLVTSVVEPSCNHSVTTRNQSSANAVTGNQPCNNAFADDGIGTVGGPAGDADHVVARSTGVLNGSRTTVEGSGELKVCGGFSHGVSDDAERTSGGTRVSPLEGQNTTGSSKSICHVDEEHIPFTCSNSANVPQLLIDLMHLVDIWNVMTVLRDHGLDAIDPFTEIPLAKVVTVISDLYESLRDRLPSVAQFSIEPCITQLAKWFSYAFNGQMSGQLRLLSVQVALSALCAGHMSDKLRYIFGQLSMLEGHTHATHLQQYLYEVLNIPATVFEPSTRLSNSISKECVDWCLKFCGVRTPDSPGSASTHVPPCLQWLSILHKLPRVENVVHSMSCSHCHCCPIVGFRYECQKCENCSLCQRCFWSGLYSGNHAGDHGMKEFAFPNSASRKTSRKQPALPSLLNIAQQNKGPIEYDKSFARASSSGYSQSFDECCHSKTSSTDFSPGMCKDMSSSPLSTLSRSKRIGDSIRVDDEHRLIARYVERLANYSNSAMGIGSDDSNQKHHLVAELKAKNREILREIQQLRMQQRTNRSDFSLQGGAYSPALSVELQHLRQRRGELETRMKMLHSSRRELMLQLETLTKLLKNPLTPWSTPTNSPRSKILPPPPMVAGQHIGSGSNGLKESVAAVSGDIQQVFSYDHLPQLRPSTSSSGSGGGNTVQYLRKDLICATDSLTNAVSSLVRELNSEDSSDSEGDVFKAQRAYEKFRHSPDKWRPESRELWDARLHKEREVFVVGDESYSGKSINTAVKQFSLESSNELYDKDPRI